MGNVAVMWRYCKDTVEIMNRYCTGKAVLVGCCGRIEVQLVLIGYNRS